MDAPKRYRGLHTDATAVPTKAARVRHLLLPSKTCSASVTVLVAVPVGEALRCISSVFSASGPRTESLFPAGYLADGGHIEEHLQVLRAERATRRQHFIVLMSVRVMTSQSEISGCSARMEEDVRQRLEPVEHQSVQSDRAIAKIRVPWLHGVDVRTTPSRSFCEKQRHTEGH